MLTEDILAKTVGADPLDIQSTFVGAVCRWQAANPAGLIDITRFWFEQGSLDNERQTAEQLEYQIETRTIAGVRSIVMRPERSERLLRCGQRRRWRGGLVGESAGAGYRRLRDGDQADGDDPRHQRLARGHVEGDQRGAAERQLRPTVRRCASTAMAEVGNFVEMFSAAVALLPSAVARPSATCDIAGSCPITSSVSTSLSNRDATLLISSITAPGVGVVEPLDVVHRRLDPGPSPVSPGCGWPSSTARRRSRVLGAQPVPGQPGLADTPWSQRTVVIDDSRRVIRLGVPKQARCDKGRSPEPP